MKNQKWSMKAMSRLIVTSATYRQSSAVTPPLLEKDPYNRLLARGPRFRMEAEMIRDAMLAASGLLNRKIGGPSVMPPQPEGIWDNPYDGDRVKWRASEGEDRYRRGLYTFLRRTAPHPSLVAFDATSREVCAVKRVRTNTPLQALTLLNDEAVMEMARALARRARAEAPRHLRGQLTYAFRLCAARKPTAKEVDRLVALYERQLELYSVDRHAAVAVLGETEQAEASPVMAAWTMVASVLLNLDETITKE